MVDSYLRNPFVYFAFVHFRWRSLVMISNVSEKPFHVRRKEVIVFYGEFSIDSSIVSIYFGMLLLLLPTCGSTYAYILGFLLNIFWILNMALLSLFEYFGSRCPGETWVVIFHSTRNTHCSIPIKWWAGRIISHSYMFVCVTTPTGFLVLKGFWIFKSVTNYSSTSVMFKLGSSYLNNHLCICVVVNLTARPSYATDSLTRGGRGHGRLHGQHHSACQPHS